MTLDTTQKEWEVFSSSHNIENAIICFPAKDGHVPQILLATQTMLRSGFHNKLKHTHTHKHIYTGEKWKLLLPPVVGTSTFLKDIEALAKYRPLKLRLQEAEFFLEQLVKRKSRSQGLGNFSQWCLYMKRWKLTA